ncbi:MAG: CopG family transcriptional regulator [Tardiphaga sp.]|nr:CopG family transcriptional regulator [Tardiphaga sp.]
MGVATGDGSSVIYSRLLATSLVATPTRLRSASFAVARPTRLRCAAPGHPPRKGEGNAGAARPELGRRDSEQFFPPRQSVQLCYFTGMNTKVSIEIDEQTADLLAARAAARGISVSQLVGELAGGDYPWPTAMEAMRRAGEGPWSPEVLVEDARRLAEYRRTGEAVRGTRSRSGCRVGARPTSCRCRGPANCEADGFRSGAGRPQTAGFSR